MGNCTVLNLGGNKYRLIAVSSIQGNRIKITLALLARGLTGVKGRTKEAPDEQFHAQFHATIKDIPRRLGEPAVELHSFIVSNCSSFAMKML